MSLQDLLSSVAKPFAQKFKETEVKFQLAREELPTTGLMINNPFMEYVFDRRFIAYGRFYLIYGKKGNSKTSFLFDLFKLFIRNGGDALWIETERAADLDYARKQGVDVDGDHFAMQQPATLEEGLTLLKLYISKYAEKYPNGDGPPFIIGFDSIAGTMTEYEQENDTIGETKVGNHAKLMADFYRKTRSLLATEKIVVVMLNQLKDKIGGMSGFGQEVGEAMLGGEAPRFESTYQFKMVRTKDMVGPDQFGAERKVGSIHEITVKRNKLGREGNSQKAIFKLYIDGGADWYGPGVEELSDTYKSLMMKHTGGWYTWRTEGHTFLDPVLDENNVTQWVEKPFPTDEKYREGEMGLMLSRSESAKELIRTHFGIPAPPADEVVKEIEKDNKKKRSNRKKNSDDDAPAIKEL